MKNCKSCYWCQQCGGDCPCEFYEPLVIKETEEKRYKSELRAREKEYKKQLREQNK